MGMIDMTKGEADYLKYRFKQYLGSVSREIQNRKLKEQRRRIMDRLIYDDEIEKILAEHFGLDENDVRIHILDGCHCVAIMPENDDSKIGEVLKDWEDCIQQKINALKGDSND